MSPRIPFLNTDPNWDIRVSMMLLPLWWSLGVEQIVGLGITFVVLCKIAFRNTPVRRFPGAWFLYLFLIVNLLSAFSIEEGYRFISFGKQFLTYAGGAMIAFVVYQTHRSTDEIIKTCWALAITGGLSATAAAIGIAGWDLKFTAPAASLLPSGLPSGLIGAIMDKSWIQHEADYFMKGWPRPRGLFVYGNHFSCMTAIGMAIKIGLYRWAPGRAKPFIVGAVIVEAVVLIFSLSRGVWLAGFGAIVVVWGVRNISVSGWGRRVALAVMVLALAVSFGVTDIAMGRFFEKGHSNEGRMDNYEQVVEEVTNDFRHFALGYGTQRTVANLAVPLGSHSTYLGILFRHGALGLGLFCGFLGVVWLRLVRMVRKCESGTRALDLGKTLLAGLSITMLQAIVTELDLVDMAFAHMWWILIGLSISLAGRSNRSVVGLVR